jgi:hypothetical protein
MRPLGIAEIADRIQLEPGGWSAVVVDDAHVDSITQKLEEELAFLLEGDSTGNVRVLRYGSAPQSLIESVAKLKPEDVAVLPLPQGSIEQVVRVLDYERARLVHGPRGVILTSGAGVAILATVAPNLWSWIGPRAWLLDPTAGQLDIAARLASLHEGTGLTDSEVIERAEAGTLGPDPVFAEWLVLLGRSDLLDR